MNRKCRIPRRWIAEQVQLNPESRRNLLVGTAALNLAKADRKFCAAMRKIVLETVTDPEARAYLLDCLPPDIRRID